MADKNLSLALRLYTDAARMLSGLVEGRRGVKGFTSFAKQEFESLRRVLGTVEGKLAGIGVTIGATQQIIASARLDKTLTQIGQTAGVGRDEIRGLRAELFGLAGETGQGVEDLREGFNSLIQSGLDWQESLSVINATNKAMAVTGANAQVLASGLSVAGENFQFKLDKPGLALELLDKMVVAGRKGNAELENLSSIFARVGPNARGAGLGFDQTLAFIEGLSLLERQPERLATLADSTLRLFTNLRYARSAQAATGVRFFDEAGSRRDPVEVLREIRAQFRLLETDAQRAKFIGRAFGNTDLDTQRGMRSLLSGDLLDRIGGFTADIRGATGAIARDLPAAIANSVDQVGRLKAELREAADGFIQPFNRGLASGIKKALDKPEQGGLGLSGGQLIGGAAAVGVGALLAGRFGGPLLKKLAGRLGGTAAGVAEGKALEAAAGVTPVFVVNMPGGGILGGGAGISVGAGLPGTLRGGRRILGGVRAGAAILGSVPLSMIPSLGAGALAASAGAAGAAGLAGYGVGTLISKTLIEGTKVGDAIGRAITLAMSPFSEAARDALALRAREREMEGTLKIEIDSAGNPRVREVRTANPYWNIDVLGGGVPLAVN